MPEGPVDTIGLVIELIRLVLTAVIGLVGVIVGARLRERGEEAQRRHAFLERQLREFYSPLLGLRAEIRAKGELRVRVNQAANAAWRELVEQARAAGGPEAIQEMRQRRGQEFIDRMIDYDNKQLTEEILPFYRRMVEVFRENQWLAEPETRGCFGTVIEFLGIWDRWLAKTLPPEAVERLEHSEAPLHPLYEHLETKHDELRGHLARGKG